MVFYCISGVKNMYLYNMKKNINKREFIKYGLIGMGGLVSGIGCLNHNGENSSNFIDETTNVGSSDAQTGEGIKEALFYIKTPRGLKCQICPHMCTIKPNETSTCKTRVNKNAKLYTNTWGNPCSANVDPIEKKPLYHFLPTSRAFSVATAGCNLACLNCQNWEISQVGPEKTKNYDLPPEKVSELCLKYDCKSIAYTYSEPVVFYEYTYDSAKIAHKNGIKNVLVSAGYINEKPLRTLAKYIDAANIDLKSFDNNIYIKLNDGTLQPILNTLKILKEENVWLEITNLIIPSWTDDLDMIRRMCDWLFENQLHNYPLHFSRFYPMYKLTHIPSTPVSTLEKAAKIAKEAGIKFVYIGNVPGNNAENTYCPDCNKLIIERKGYTITQNHIVNNSCKFCNENIPGVF